MANAEGIPVLGNVKVDGHEFVAAIPAAQLLKITRDPRDSEIAKLRAGSTELQDLFKLREEVQRMFQGAKERNVESYARYIVNLQSGSDGITPQIVLFTREKLLCEPQGSSWGTLYLPWDVEWVAIDGETQLAARFEAATINPETRKQQVDVKFCYDRPLEWAKQAFHDLNLLSVRPNAATAISMDMRDPLTSITREVAKLPFFDGRVASSRQLKKKDTGILTLSVLRTAVVCFSEGIGGLQYGNKPVPVASDRIPQVRKAAVEYFSALTDKLGPKMEQRNETVTASPAVMAALGAMGHKASAIGDEGARQAEIALTLHALDGVDWSRGPKWDGVAGKVRPDGTFSTAGGAKDSGHACYSALADTGSAHYATVRGLVPAVV
jgi:DNA sulfur modification protein DndB